MITPIAAVVGKNGLSNVCGGSLTELSVTLPTQPPQDKVSKTATATFVCVNHIENRAELL